MESIPECKMNDSVSKAFLWSVFRSRSTAFERSIRNLQDVKVYHEPFDRAAHFGEDSDIGDVKSLLEGAFRGYRGVFVKDMPVSFVQKGKLDYVPDGYCHAFLIRSPAHTVTSLYRCLLAEQTENEAAIYVSKMAGYHELWETYQYIRDVKGQTPMVIDSDDNLLYDPATTMKKFCDFAGFEFKESMLHWKSGPVEGWSWPFAGDWYSSVMNSSGFVTVAHEVHDKASQVDVGSYPELIQKTIRDSELYYEKLYNLRTKPSS